MSAEDSVQDKKTGPVDDETDEQPSLAESRARASSLLQWLREDREAPDPVEAISQVPVDETEIKDHRQLYLGYHFPIKPKRGRRNQYRSHHGRKVSTKDKPQNGKLGNLPPAERVRFILGGDDNDVERQIFTEMDVLYCNGSGVEEWKETARWLKFEEIVEEGGNRWSKPHVASLSLYSLFELRSCVLSGTVLLDLNASTVAQIADIVLDDLVYSRQLDVAWRSRVREIFLRRHRHLHERRKSTQRKKSIRGNKKASTATNILEKAGGDDSDNNFGKSETEKSLYNMDEADSNIPKVPTATSLIEQEATIGDISNDADAESSKFDVNFMRKIPQGAEGSMVLVGEVDFLSKPVTAFVRLEDAQIIGDFLEVPIPTRFIFLMLGPSGQPGRYHEVGRAIGTLMSDEVFRDVAYKATCREDITAGIDEFLQQVTVLPPGEWDPSIRIEPPASVPSQENRRLQQECNGKENGVGAKTNGTGGGGGDDGDGNDNKELVRTGRFGGGLILDIKRKAKHYKSDFVDALNSQCLATVLFIYFAVLAPIVTFGAVMETKTDKYMGAMEVIVAATIGGVLFPLLSGQPLTILGATGPMLVFEGILYNFCQRAELDYMPFRMWIGLWTTFFCLILVVTDASAMVWYFTRFTQESFATLIGLIFIYEGCHKLFDLSKKYPVPSDNVMTQSCKCMMRIGNGTNGTGFLWIPSNKTIDACDSDDFKTRGNGCGGAVFLLSTILTLGTFFLVIKLKSFRTSRFFPTKVRRVVSDFAAIISVMIMVGVDAAFGIGTPKLNIPTSFRPTNAEARGWIISPLGENPWWTMIAASIPALLTTILVFMDQQITAVIVNKREHKLKKGAGYHLDLTIVAVVIGICSILGVPWVVAATVESLSHTRSLFVESQCTAPGERSTFLGVREQRVTGTIVYILVGLTVFLAKFLKHIPMPVLYGLFIYMGVSALRGVQLFERVKILFMPGKHQPDRVYLRKVRIHRIHIFTGIQVMCLVLLWVIKATAASITFPLMVLALVVVRKLMDKIFTKQELEVLDDVMPESVKKKIEEADEADTEDSKPLVEEPPATRANDDKGINISEEVKNCTLWKSMEGNKETPHDSDRPGEGKPHKHKNKHKHRHKHKHKHHHHHHGGKERKLATVTDAPDLEMLVNDEETDSPAIPLVTLTSADEPQAKKDENFDTTMNNEEDDALHVKDTKPLRPLSI